MDTAAMKSEIMDLLNRLSDEALAEVLENMHMVETKYTVHTDILSNLDQLLNANKNLLKRLA